MQQESKRNLRLNTYYSSVDSVRESELYRPSDGRLSAKLVPNFVDSGMSLSQRCGSPTAVISVSTIEELLDRKVAAPV
jgi:hypothetical protein